MQLEYKSVVIIGAGPSGSVAASMLCQHDTECLILEKEQFPRFSIGESLLPQCMPILEKAKMTDAIKQHGFQYKNGAAFHKSESNGADKETLFNFSQKFSEGPGDTFQVQRADFDKILADEAQKAGADIRYQHQIMDVEERDNDLLLTVKDLTQDQNYQISCKVLLDASGFARVLPRLMQLEYPSDFPVRHSYFAHFNDNIQDESFDRNKILIAIHPEFSDVWYWLIPFQDGSASIGVVGQPHFFENFVQASNSDILQELIQQQPKLSKLLVNAEMKFEARALKGYSANVTRLYGERFVLLGNAGEFLDPVFSSGVTIALKSAELAVPLVLEKLKGNPVDWENDYSRPLKQGVDAFRAFVTGWYDGRFQKVIFEAEQDDNIRAMICSILAGYAWDTKNPYVAQPEKRLNTLAQLCGYQA